MIIGGDRLRCEMTVVLDLRKAQFSVELTLKDENMKHEIFGAL